MTPDYLDYILVVIDANNGITTNTKVFYKIAQSMNLPIITIITKIDLIDADDLKLLISNLKEIHKLYKKTKIVVESKEDIVLCSRILEEPIFPIFLVR